MHMYSVCVLHVSVCVCVGRMSVVVCFDSAEIVVQVMEASYSTTKQIVFLPDPLACCRSSEPGSLYAPWRGNSFPINTVCEADRLLTQTLVLVSICHKFLRKSSENKICAQNTSVGVSCRREKDDLSVKSVKIPYSIFLFLYLIKKQLRLHQ